MSKILNYVTDKLDEVLGKDRYRLICVAITGSSAYGIQTKDSDTDVTGLFLPMDEGYFNGMKTIEHIELDKTSNMEGMMYDFRFWYKLMCEQNPNVLEMLWYNKNSYVFRDKLIWPIIFGYRKLLLSKKLKHSFDGYSHSQLIRITKLNEKANQNEKRKATIEKYGYDTKAASTAIRLLSTALDALVMHEIIVMRPDRHLLIAIREGRYTYEELVKLAEDKHRLIETAYVESTLRNQIDQDYANDLLCDIVKTHLGYTREIKTRWKFQSPIRKVYC